MHGIFISRGDRLGKLSEECEIDVFTNPNAVDITWFRLRADETTTEYNLPTTCALKRLNHLGEAPQELSPHRIESEGVYEFGPRKTMTPFFQLAAYRIE